MHHLTTMTAAAALAVATGRGHLALQAPVGTDFSGLAGILPDEALRTASEVGGVIIAFDDFVEGALTYSNVERRMCVVPGGTVTLFQHDGSTRRRHQPLDNLVTLVTPVPATRLLAA